MLCQAREKNFYLQQFTISNLAGWGKRVGLTPHWPAAFVIFENVLKEGIKYSLQSRCISLCLPLLSGSRVKNTPTLKATINRMALTAAASLACLEIDREMRRRLILHETGFAR